MSEVITCVISCGIVVVVYLIVFLVGYVLGPSPQYISCDCDIDKDMEEAKRNYYALQAHLARRRTCIEEQ